MKFSTREWFMLTAIIGLAIGWVLDKNIYHRNFTAVDQLNGALYRELRSKNPATQIRINVKCGGVETRYGYPNHPLEE